MMQRGEQVHLLNLINVHSKAQTGRRQDILDIRRWLKAATVRQSGHMLKEIECDIECGPLTSRQHFRCCHCEQSHGLWESACVSMGTHTSVLMWGQWVTEAKWIGKRSPVTITDLFALVCSLEDSWCPFYTHAWLFKCLRSRCPSSDSI